MPEGFKRRRKPGESHHVRRIRGRHVINIEDQINDLRIIACHYFRRWRECFQCHFVGSLRSTKTMEYVAGWTSEVYCVMCNLVDCKRKSYWTLLATVKLIIEDNDANGELNAN
jgi:hypothetical protein